MAGFVKAPKSNCRNNSAIVGLKTCKVLEKAKSYPKEMAEFCYQLAIQKKSLISAIFDVQKLAKTYESQKFHLSH